MNLDASASYKINEQFTVTLEAINLTDQFDDRWISSQRDSSEEYVHTGRQYYLGLRYKF